MESRNREARGIGVTPGIRAINAPRVWRELGYDDCDIRWLPFITNCEAGGTVVTWSAGCDVPEALKIKPEVVAPGVDIYSSVPGASYEVWSGSAMAGPHVAGVVALLRSADPNIEVDTIKEILMATARDEGPAGEDNAYGWGVIDAYAAVLSLAPVSAPPPAGGVRTGLLAVRPNPFTYETSIHFRLRTGGPVKLTVHDSGGRMVRELLGRSLPEGDHTTMWDSRDESGHAVPAGVYLSILRAPGSTVRRSLLLLH